MLNFLLFALVGCHLRCYPTTRTKNSDSPRNAELHPTLKSNTDRSRPRTQIPPTRNETLLKEEPVKRTRDTANEGKKICRHPCCGSSSLGYLRGVDGSPEISGALVDPARLTNLASPNLLARPRSPGQHTQTPTLCTVVAPLPLTIHVTQAAPA